MVTIRELVEQYFDSINNENWPQLEALWRDNSELLAVGSAPRTGREEIMQYYKSAFAPWAKHCDTPTRLITEERAVAVEIRFAGVTHDGARIDFDAVDVFDMRSDYIRHLSSWYDLAWLRKRLAAG